MSSHDKLMKNDNTLYSTNISLEYLNTLIEVILLNIHFVGLLPLMMHIIFLFHYQSDGN